VERDRPRHESLGIDIGADGPQKLASRAFHGGVVDAARPGTGVGRLRQG
jgi:hypothetical protein